MEGQGEYKIFDKICHNNQFILILFLTLVHLLCFRSAKYRKEQTSGKSRRR